MLLGVADDALVGAALLGDDLDGHAHRRGALLRQAQPVLGVGESRPRPPWPTARRCCRRRTYRSAGDRRGSASPTRPRCAPARAPTAPPVTRRAKNRSRRGSCESGSSTPPPTARVRTGCQPWRVRCTVPVMSIGNVLFGTDFTESAGNAVSRIAWLPISRGSSVTVVHALPRRLPARYLAAFQRGASHKLELTRQELLASERRDFEVFTALDEGHPTEVVCRRAHDEEAQLIVVGRGRQRRLVLVGSTAERVARASEVPHAGGRGAGARALPRPLVAIDRTAQALDVLASRCGCAATAPLTVVHAFLAVRQRPRPHAARERHGRRRGLRLHPLRPSMTRAATSSRWCTGSPARSRSRSS